MTCHTCIYRKACEEWANSIEEEFNVSVALCRCDLFKNAADFAEVKHGEIKYINRPTPAKFAYVKGTDGTMYYGKLYDKMDYNPVAYCSLCNKRLADSFQNYCPYCGALLEGFKPTPQFEEEIEDILKGCANNA